MNSSTTAPAIVDAFFSAQERTVRIARSTSETAARTIESWSEQLNSALPEQFRNDNLSLATGDLIPAPTQAVDSYFSMVEGLLGQERELLNKFVNSSDEAPAAASAKTKK
jgi:hypothetical protein